MKTICQEESATAFGSALAQAGLLVARQRMAWLDKLERKIKVGKLTAHNNAKWDPST